MNYYFPLFYWTCYNNSNFVIMWYKRWFWCFEVYFLVYGLWIKSGSFWVHPLGVLNGLPNLLTWSLGYLVSKRDKYAWDWVKLGRSGTSRATTSIMGPYIPATPCDHMSLLCSIVTPSLPNTQNTKFLLDIWRESLG